MRPIAHKLYIPPTLQRLAFRAIRFRPRSERGEAGGQRMNVYGRVWESEEIELLRQRQKAGLPLAETARLLGRSYACVKSYASDHGILQGEKPWTRAEDACMVLLVRKGSSPAEISMLMGRTDKAIKQRLNRLGLRLNELRALGPLPLDAKAA